jgi:uncharacterized protein HemX
METLSIVVTEILLCLALAWALGFLAAWILFRKVQNEYENEIEELEENLLHVSSANKNQEREITMQNLKIQELKKGSVSTTNNSSEVEDTKESEPRDEKLEMMKKKSQDEEILKLIESNLYEPKKN